MNLGRYISRTAMYYPDRIAVADDQKQLTYREFEERANRLAQGLLSLGLRPGDPVAVQSWNRSEVVEFEVACLKAGLTRLPVNARLSAAEVTHVLTDGLAKTALVGPEHVDLMKEVQPKVSTLKHIVSIGQQSVEGVPYETLLTYSSSESPDVEVEPDDVAVLHYSSGTTGNLKAIMQTFGNRLSVVRKVLMTPGVEIGPGSNFAHVGPITHASGMFLVPTLFSGGCNRILSRFDPERLLAVIQNEDVHYVLFVPTMINMILAYPKAHEFDLSSLKRVLYGASPISVSRIKDAMEFFGPILIQGYGMGETTSLVTVFSAQEHARALQEGDDRRLASCGRAVFDTEIRIVDDEGKDVKPGEVGEIIVRGPDVMKGYYKMPDLTAENLKDGWMHTRDMATFDADGYIYIVDRKSDMIITGGFNVYPSEVEQVLYAHPAVYEACVVGVPDDKWGEAIKALCVLKSGASATEEDIILYCSKALASYKKPHSVDFVDELPKNPNGKVVRRLVREKYWTQGLRRVN